MDSELAGHVPGNIKQTMNLMDYRDSLRKTIRYRSTRRRRRKVSRVDAAHEVEETVTSNDDDHHENSSAKNATARVGFKDNEEERESRATRPKRLSIKSSNQEPCRPNVFDTEAKGSQSSVLGIEGRRASTQPDNVPVMLADDMKRSWEDRDNSKTITSEHEFLAWIVDEIQQSAAGIGRPRQTSHFFNIVLGGNVHLIKKVLRYLKKFRMKNELTWVLGATPKEYSETTPCLPCTKIAHVFLCFCWSIIFVALTPVFYTLHILVYFAHLSTRGRMSLVIELPLVFAVLSEDPDMIQVFLDAGCPLDGVDLKGNNVYHYLADISLDDPEKAVRCHLILCAGVENLKYIKTLITEKTNRFGITALEAIAKYGSTHFLRFIMVDKSCIGNLRLSVSKDMLWADLKHEVFDIKGSDTSSLSGYSFSTDREDAECEASLNVWEFDISRYEMGDAHGKQSYLLQLVASRSVDSMSEIDVWGFMQSKLLQKWISVKYKWYLPLSVFSHVMYLIITVLVLVFIVNHGGDVDPAPLFSIFLRHDTEEVIRAGRVIVNLSEESLANTSIWDVTCMGWDIIWQDEIVDIAYQHQMIIDNCSATALSRVKESCKSVDSLTLLAQTLNRTLDVEAGVGDSSPVRHVLDIMIIIHVILDIIIRQGFLFRNYNFEARTLTHGIWPVLIRRFPGSYTEKQLSTLMYAFYVAFIYINYLWSLVVKKHYDKYREYSAYLFNRSQSTGNIEEHQARAKMLNDLMTTEAYLAGLAGNFLMVCLMLRFIHTIHALRLLPGVGFFVITTKKMAKHLLQFTIVFLIVSLAFATIFYFVMRKVDCPANKIEGFDSLMTSLFSTYQVALGYGEYDFTSSLNARIAYVAYTIISILLLMNLIIAVMTTTAEELNKAPWKQALCCLERWDEILGTEVAARTVFAPFTYLYALIRHVGERSCWKKRSVWEDIKKSDRKTFEVTYMK